MLRMRLAARRLAAGFAAALAVGACGPADAPGGQEVSTEQEPSPARQPGNASISQTFAGIGGGLGSRSLSTAGRPVGQRPAVAGPARPGLGPVAPGAAGFASTAAPDQPGNVYAHVVTSQLSPAVAGVPVRVYVPNSAAGTVSVIDPETLAVVDRYATGQVPHHVTPSWDLTELYVNNTESNTFTVIDPASGKPLRQMPVEDPYNLYFTPDGTKAIVVAERYRRLDFFERKTWTKIKSLSIPWPGVDHGDFTADGRYFLASTEFSGQVVKVDTEAMEVVGRADVGSLPIDVKVSPDGDVFYVANQGRHGVSIVDPDSMTEIGFLKTGTGAHGLNPSRDARLLYVSNRLDGSITVIDFATRTVKETWKIGGSPDMIQVSADGRQLWVSNRYHGSVSVVDTTTGKLITTIATGAGAHGLSLFPQPGRYNVGHNGVFR
jgi:YVTN family beta-propeller protein